MVKVWVEKVGGFFFSSVHVLLHIVCQASFRGLVGHLDVPEEDGLGMIRFKSACYVKERIIYV